MPSLLRVHSQHSLLTGRDAPAELLEQAAQLGWDSVALTDVDGMSGLVEFLQAPECGLRRVVGAELSEASGALGRVVALVESAAGYANVCRLVSARRLGGDPGEAGADLPGPAGFDLVESVARWSAGLVLLVDHPRLAYALEGRVARGQLFVGVAPQCWGRAARGELRAARPGESRNAHTASAAHGPLREVWSREAREERLEGDSFKTPPPPRAVGVGDLVESARALGLELVALPDVHCARPGGERSLALRAALKHNALLDSLPAECWAEAPAHMLAPAELERLYRDLPGALARTDAVAERCGWAPKLGGVLFPKVELGPRENAYSRLAALAFEGARTRYRPLRPEVVRRLDYELGAIEQLGYAPYFLLVRRIADFARERGIPHVGRGSAADSLVAYCLGLTEADPLRYRLPFERFLNPTRKDRPDIDLDFCWRRRDEVLGHVYEAFGRERTAMICTLNRFGLRAAFRETALALGLPPAEIQPWTSRFPWSAWDAPEGAAEHDGSAQSAADEPQAQRMLPAAAGGAALVRRLRALPELAQFPFEDARFARALAAAADVHGAPRHLGLHPGGVVVAPQAITELVACARTAKGLVCTQLDKDGVEALGLVKMDLLGNRALTVIDDCLGLLRARGAAPELDNLDEADEPTGRLLRAGQTLGCFQIESPGMRNLLVQSQARDMDRVIQAVAVIRPGPASSGMKDAYIRRLRGLEEPHAPHPRLTELLWDTRGVMLYQEDLMMAAVALAGMELAEADQLRRALCKGRRAELVALEQRFHAGCAQNGLTSAESQHAWELIANFSSFGFCKAHAVTYGRIAYRAAWLKAHHPAAFLAAFLASDTGYYDARVYVEEARRLGVGILGPDVNKSGAHFTLETRPTGAALRVGFASIKGFARGSCERLLAARAAGGAFVSLPDLLERVRPERDEAAALIRVGALDGFDRSQPELLWRLELLHAPARRAVPKLPPTERLDPGLLLACRATPDSRESEALRAARAQTGGFGRVGLGLGQAELSGGEALLFAAPPLPALSLPRLADFDARTRALAELELLGFPLRQHPVRIFPLPAPLPPGPQLVGCGELMRHSGQNVRVYGWLAAGRRAQTEQGEWMRFLTLEDESGLCEGVLFPREYTRLGASFAGRGPFLVQGAVEDTLGAANLRVTGLDS